MTRVLINALHAKTGGGITYLRQMLPLLAADPRLDLHLIAHEDQCESLAPLDARVRFHPIHFANGFVRTQIWEQIVLPWRARKMGVDVTFSPANFGPLAAPRPVIMLRNALGVVAHDDRPTKRIYWRVLGWMTALSLLTCRRAIAVSGYARETLGGRFGEKVTVIPHGVDDAFRKIDRGPGESPYLLAVGDIYVQKNLRTLLAAFMRVHAARPELRLKIAGRPVDMDYAALVREDAARLGVADATDFLGTVPRETLMELYAGCSVFVFPSTVETFGQPLVEAMAAGAPVACADAAAMPEIAGDAVHYFDPLDSGAMADRILALLSDPALAARLSAAARRRSQAYSWPETARRTADLLLAAAGTTESASDPAVLAPGNR
jgi:glycosyltransferase involved in cell wall biosynthesis